MADTLDLARPLPVGSAARHASGWWGMWCLIATEASLFGYLLFSYGYLAARAHGDWVPELPRLRIALPNTILLLASSAVLYWGERGIRNGRRARLAVSLSLTLAMGLGFSALQGLEWRNKTFHPGDSAYASSYFIITGFHMLHVAAGLVTLAFLLAWTLLAKFGAERHCAVSVGALYWHFVDAVWLAVFTALYLTPYLQ
jgi:heme/copper-type cytochrome/quinol oxidase subunit 3